MGKGKLTYTITYEEDGKVYEKKVSLGERALPHHNEIDRDTLQGFRRDLFAIESAMIETRSEIEKEFLEDFVSLLEEEGESKKKE